MRILLAEDERELADWLVRALQQSDFQVDWVDDGRLVRRSLKATRYDALILDLGLPGLGGHDVLADLRDADQRLPVLILTARDSLIERVSSLNEGADDFLAKPFELAELEARLLALIRRARGSDHPRCACGALDFGMALGQLTQLLEKVRRVLRFVDYDQDAQGLQRDQWLRQGCVPGVRARRPGAAGR
jgi:two-component system response regulator TctD